MADIPSQLRSITRESFSSDSDRQLAVAEARALLSRIETPWETGFRQSWIEPSCMACLKITSNLDLWTKWVENGGAPKTLDELFKFVIADYTLFSRIIWALAGAHLLEVVKDGVFGLTPFTSALGQSPQILSTVNMYFDMQSPVFHALPEYIKSIKFQNPTDHANGAFTFWAGLPLWEWLKTHPDAEKTVGAVMQAHAANQPHLSEVYPAEKLVQNAPGGSVVFVDIGGSVGHHTLSFAKTHGSKPGTLVLQDRKVVLDNAGELDPAITKMEYDFFTPQPVEGAATYYMHLVLHDWPDADCKKILDNQKLSMKKGYSKLLIHEVVLDPNNPQEDGTVSDITMMALASGMERTEKQWAAVLEASGFKINKIYSKELAAESVIEAEPI